MWSSKGKTHTKSSPSNDEGVTLRNHSTDVDTSFDLDASGEGHGTVPSIAPHSTQSSPVTLGNTKTRIVVDTEELGRVYHTKRDPRRIRTLRSLHVLPASPSCHTLAHVGVQAALPEMGTSENQWKEQLYNCHEDNAKLHDINQQLELKVSELTTESNGLRSRGDELIQRLEEACNDLSLSQASASSLTDERDNAEMKLTALRAELRAATDHVTHTEAREEALELKAAFLEEELDYAKRNMDECQRHLTELRAKYKKSVNDIREYKELFVLSRTHANEILSTYVDQLQDAVWEKRMLVAKIKDGSLETNYTLQDVLTSTDAYLSLQQENYTLEEEIEFLKTQLALRELELAEHQSKSTLPNDVPIISTAQVDLRDTSTIARKHSGRNHELSVVLPVSRSSNQDGKVKSRSLPNQTTGGTGKLAAVDDVRLQTEFARVEVKSDTSLVAPRAWSTCRHANRKLHGASSEDGLAARAGYDVMVGPKSAMLADGKPNASIGTDALVGSSNHHSIPVQALGDNDEFKSPRE